MISLESWFIQEDAAVAELADALRSGRSELTLVMVQIHSAAPQ